MFLSCMILLHLIAKLLQSITAKDKEETKDNNPELKKIWEEILSLPTTTIVTIDNSES